jgi:3-oxoacyl-[acyl-carrier protein] reductase
MIMRFEGKTAIVAGAARGVGARVVEMLVAEGAQVVACDVLDDLAGERFASLKQAVQVVHADVSRSEECDRLALMAADAFGHVDLLVANAGITVRASLDQTTDSLWRQAIDHNLGSAFGLARAFLPLLREEGGGAIVNNASINAIRGNVALAAYSAAKAGMLGLTRALAKELAPDRIRVNAVCPGTIDTPMTDEYLSSVEDPKTLRRSLEAKHPLGRLATADDVANAVVFLGSEDAAFITGVALPVDGGRHLA